MAQHANWGNGYGVSNSTVPQGYNGALGELLYFGASGTTEWGQGYGSNGTDLAVAVASDTQGNTYLTGAFASLIIIGNTTLVS